MWSFEYRIRSWPADRRGTVQRWRWCSVATRPALKIADTRAHFAPARYSHPVFQRQQECASRRPYNPSIKRTPRAWPVSTLPAALVRRGKARGRGGLGAIMGAWREGLLRKMLAHYRMLRFLRWGRWRSAKATIRTFWNLYVGGRSLER
jgi:hypothetical protein